MPHALKHARTGTLLAGFQVNGYELTYYGLFLWEGPPEREQIAYALAQAGIDAEDEDFHAEKWEAFEMSEHEAKMANVKLRNDPRRVVYHRDGAFHAVSVPQQA